MSVRAFDGPMMPAQGENALRDLLRVVFRLRWIIVVPALLTAGVAMFFSIAMPPTYEASSLVIADRSPPVVMLANSGQQSSLFQQQVAQAPDVATLTEIAKSEAVRAGAAARLAHLVDPAQAKNILSRLRVQQVRNTDLVRIVVAHTDPNVAAIAANAVADSVVSLDLDARRRFVTRARKFIGEQLEAERQKLQTSEAMLASFKSQYRDVSLTEQTLLSLRRLSDLEQRLGEVRLQSQEADAGYAPVVSAGVKTGSAVAQSAPDPLITTLQNQLASLEVELSGLRRQFTPMHPQVVSFQAKIEETKRRLSDAIARNRAALTARQQGLSADISQVQQGLMQVPTREATLARLTRSVKEAERTSLLLSEQFQEARIAESSIGSSVRIVEVAKPPQKAAWPRRGMNTVLGGVVGLMLGVAGAYIVEQLDDTVKSPEEAAHLLGAPVLGMIPSLPRGNGRTKSEHSLLTHTEQTSEAAEAFRVLRTHVLGAMRVADYKCLLITSAAPLEGKSTIAANLAIAIAQSGRSAWLVDCAVRHSTLKDLFPEADSPGLSSLLNGQAAIEDVVRQTAQPRLSCVVSGPTVSSPTELLDTQLMTGLLTTARVSADVILLDSPAILPVADAEVLGLHADGAVMVVQTGRTERRALIEARQRLQHVGVSLVGVVLNQSPGPS